MPELPDGELYLPEEVRSHLVTAGLVRNAETPFSEGAPPPCLYAPRDGAPEPPKLADEDRMIVAIGPGREIPGDWLEGFLIEESIDVVVRSFRAGEGRLLQRQIRGELDEIENTLIGDLRCEWSKLWRGYRVVASDSTSFTSVQSFRIACRVKSLAGMPYAP